ncbi:MAG TPA: aldolase/citrate lyase family protein, partial [Thermodesulfobacteriota bacterium]|nr:aldolase/citrate lyase family protein [Thermodesulfobacteriota bacterium]
IIIDMEHGSFGIDKLVDMIRGVQIGGSTPVVRVPDHSETGIFKALDAGAVGLIVPGVSTAEQARKIARAARYAPQGNRGACPRVRATSHGISPWDRHVEWSNRNVMVWTIIETVEGFDNLEEIVKVPGIDAMAFGAFDLSQDMGLGGNTDHPEVRKRIEKGFATAVRNNVAIQIQLFEADPKAIRESAARWVSLGAKILTCMTDRRVLALGMKETCASLASVRK